MRFGPFGKSILTLSIGTSLSQAISMLFYPILGRMYSPEEFGLLASVTVISSVVIVFATGKYEQSILITKTDTEAANILGVSIFLAVVICSILAICFFLFSSTISNWLNVADIKNWLVVIPLISLFIVVYNCYNEWCIKHSLFSQLSVNKVLNSLSVNLSKVICGFYGIVNGLVLGEVLGRAVSALLCFGSLLKKDIRMIKERVSKKEMLIVLKKYKKFPFYTMPDQLISTLSGAFPMFFLMKYFGTAEYGYFSMVQLVLSFPAALIGQSVMDAFRRQASLDFEANGECYPIFRRIFRIILGLSGLAYLPIYFLLPFVFSFFLGAKWDTAGIYAQIILPVIVLGFIYNIFSAIWIIAEKLKERFLWQLYYCFALLISLGLGSFLLGNIKSVLLLYTIGMSSSYLIGIWCMYKYSKKIIIIS